MNGNTEQISTPPSLHFDLGETWGGGTDTRLLPGLSCCLLRKGERMVRLWVSLSALLGFPLGTFVLGPERAFCYTERPTIDKVLQRA